jgi:hypothetical protein
VVPEGDDRETLVGPEVSLVGPSGSYARIPASWLTGDLLLEDELVEAALSVLDVTQQWIAEETTQPWPAVAGPGYGGFPDPGVEVVEDKLYMWFGHKDAPVLRLEPLDVGGWVLRD